MDRSTVGATVAPSAATSRSAPIPARLVAWVRELDATDRLYAITSLLVICLVLRRIADP